MTWVETILSLLLLTASGLALVAHRRYKAMQRKHKLLQRLYDHAEQQLTTLWANKKS